jgi:hypothetical protein
VVGPLSDIWSVEVQCACTALRQIEQKDFRAVSLGFQGQDRLGFSGVREMTRDGSDTSSPDVAQERRVIVQWDRLLSMGEPDGNAVRPLVGHSWVRRESSGVDPARTNASTPLPEDGRQALLERENELIGASEPRRRAETACPIQGRSRC